MNALKCFFLPRKAARTLRRQSEEIESLEARISDLENRLAESEAAMQCSRNELEQTLEATHVLRKNLAELTDERDELAKKLAKYEGETIELEKTMGELDNVLRLNREQEQKIRSLTAFLAEARRQIAELSGRKTGVAEIDFGSIDSDLIDDTDWLRELPEE